MEKTNGIWTKKANGFENIITHFRRNKEMNNIITKEIDSRSYFNVNNITLDYVKFMFTDILEKVGITNIDTDVIVKNEELKLFNLILTYDNIMIEVDKSYMNITDICKQTIKSVFKNVAKRGICTENLLNISSQKSLDEILYKEFIKFIKSPDNIDQTHLLKSADIYSQIMKLLIVISMCDTLFPTIESTYTDVIHDILKGISGRLPIIYTYRKEGKKYNWIFDASGITLSFI